MIPKIETVETADIPFGQRIILPGEGEVAISSGSFGLDDGNFLVEWIPLTEARLAWSAVQARPSVVDVLTSRGVPTPEPVHLPYRQAA